MGQAGGLADYWALFGRRGLQGGFVWEWCDHALRRIDADGERVLAYGGDFGEPKHDGAFVCDGLVSADREAHPLLAELAALTQPVDVEWAGAGFVSVTNRRWFTSLDDLRATWVLEVDGRPVGRGVLDVPPIAPQQQCRIVGPPLPGTTGGTVAITFTFRSRRATAWAPRGSIEAVRQLLIEPETAEDRPREPARSGPRTWTSAVVDDGDRLQIGPVGIVPPALCLWRPPTDNDDPPGQWHRAESAAAGRRGWGLDRLEPAAVEHRYDGAEHVCTTTYELALGNVVHEQRRRVSDDAIEIVDEVTIPEAFDDLPRVGVRFELPAGFDTVEWFGLGPGDSYPDRRTATTLGRWRGGVREQTMPFIVPQEYGLHLDTRWFRIADGDDDDRGGPRGTAGVLGVAVRGRGSDGRHPRARATGASGDVRPSRRRPPGPRHCRVRPRHRRSLEDPRWIVPVELANARLGEPSIDEGVGLGEPGLHVVGQIVGRTHVDDVVDP